MGEARLNVRGGGHINHHPDEKVGTTPSRAPWPWSEQTDAVPG
jgi:hypothetical protein